MSAGSYAADPGSSEFVAIGAWVVPILVAPFAGSFLALLAVRVPAGESFVFGRSRCRQCSTPIAYYDLIPVLSWVLLRGRCRKCGARIDPLHLIVEIGAVMVAAWSVAEVPGWLAWVGCALGWTLLVLSAIDWRALILPDAITLPLLVCGLSFIAGVAPDGLLDHVIGAVAGFIAFAAIAVAYKRLRGRHGLGLGDAKLVAAAGAWVSWVGLPSVVAIAAAAGLAMAVGQFLLTRSQMARDGELPFGPFLSLGFWWVWLYGPLSVGVN